MPVIARSWCRAAGIGALAALLHGAQASIPPAAAQSFIGLPPPPGAVGAVRRAPDGTIEPVAPSAVAAPRRRPAGRAGAPGGDAAEPAADTLPDAPWTATQQPGRSIQPQFVEPAEAD